MSDPNGGAGWGQGEGGSGGYQPPPPPPGNYGQGGPVDRMGRPLAHWWKRVVAAIVDGVILAVPTLILGAILGLSLTGTDADDTERTGLALGFNFGFLFLSFVVGVCYMGYLNGSESGQTIGKKVMNIAVRSDETGGPIGVGNGFLRAIVYQGISQFGAFLCGLPGLINGLWPLWDPKRQAWHDKVVKSVVVEVGS